MARGLAGNKVGDHLGGELAVQVREMVAGTRVVTVSWRGGDIFGRRGGS